MVFSARLPTLLSQLPKNGQQALVRPITGNPNKLWLVTRTKLRFKPTASASASGSTDNPTDKGKGKGKGKDEGEEGVDGAVAVGGEPLKAFGRVWGMCYYHGMSLSFRYWICPPGFVPLSNKNMSASFSSIIYNDPS